MWTLLKLITIFCITLLLYLNYFPLNQEITILFNETSITINLLVIAFTLIVLISLALKAYDIISNFLMIPSLFVKKIHSFKFQQNYTYLVNCLIYLRLNNTAEAQNQASRIDDEELKELLITIINKDNTKILSKHFSGKVLNLYQDIQESINTAQIDPAEKLLLNPIFDRFPVIRTQFINQLNHLKAMNYIINHDYKLAIKILETNLDQEFSSKELIILINCYINLDKKNKALSLIEKYWDASCSYELFLMLQKIYDHLDYEAFIKESSKLFAKRDDQFYWKIYLYFYLISHNHFSSSIEISSLKAANSHQQKLFSLLNLYHSLSKHDIKMAHETASKLITDEFTV
ncbi:hypothetical protein [Rickettsiales endosymbiont of Stachyamoeba lipophora]|uniref:hypothetical protein n=1 Tax=Rickettsiales endosymbiont of Stachyamoeba lipophora TaxID=2486578 RepID=UPI000F6513C8|nr:hypothetical protein [Rickettsiales endosymbiont of Stachyamoeba lipophora]AZL15434.1 hypothetical protein EF513_02555 [Rickettsiales endosymbiont of Stachyamoeba lipophora]